MDKVVLPVSIVIFNLNILNSTLLFSSNFKQYIIFLLRYLIPLIFGEIVSMMYFQLNPISELDESCICNSFLESSYSTSSTSSTYFLTMTTSSTLPTPMTSSANTLSYGFIYSPRGVSSVIRQKLHIYSIFGRVKVCAIY